MSLVPSDRHGPPNHEPAVYGDAELQHRRRLLGIDAGVMETLASCRDLAAEEVDAITGAFYRQQLAIPEVAALIDDPAILARLGQAQRTYILDLFAGSYDASYVERRLQIGVVHRYIGVEPKYYLSAMHLLRDLLGEHLGNRLVDRPELRTRLLAALDRLLAFDTTLVMDTYIDSLVSEVETARRQIEDHAADLERKVIRRTAQLEELVRRDPLTELYNSRALRELLHRELARARRRRQPVSLVYFDLDGFKQVNDTAGHRAGDEVLRSVGDILRQTCRLEDIPCRYGGDEFCVVLAQADLDHAEAFCRRLIAAFTGRQADLSFSLGIAQAGPEQYDTVERFIDRADKLMYEAKQAPGFQIRR